MPPPLVVSACLLGRACRYDGASKPATAVQDLAERWSSAGGAVIPVCPEDLGGLGTPRPGAHLDGGDGHAVLEGRARVVRAEDGGDVTDAFVAGAVAAAERATGAACGVLKARSPSCGCGQTTIDGRFQEGDGVFAALLRRRGVQVVTDEALGALDVAEFVTKL